MHGIVVWGNCSSAMLNSLNPIHDRAARLIHDQDDPQSLNWLPLSYFYKRRLLLFMFDVFFFFFFIYFFFYFTIQITIYLNTTYNTNQLQVLLTIIQFTLLTLQNNMITYSNLQSNLYPTYKNYTNT